MKKHLLRIVALALVVMLAPCIHAQEVQDTQTASTTANPSIEVKALKYLLKPLTKDQIQVEMDAWLGLLQGNAKDISNIKVSESPDEAALSKLMDEQDSLKARVETCFADFQGKGGETKEQELYVRAVTGLDTSDSSGLWLAAKKWMTGEKALALGLNILTFLAILIAFKILSSILAGITSRAVGAMKGTSDLLRNFFVNTVRKVTFFVGLVVALSQLGVNIGPLLAAMGAAGFIIGFALQGTLSNFASGIMILLYRPYDIGQVVTIAGTTGKVDAMSLVSTTLNTPDNQTVVVPNGSIWGDIITNVTGKDTRRVDMVFGIGYEDDIQKAQSLLEEIIKAHPLTLDDPAPVVKLHELADSSVNFVARPWAKTGDYWNVYWDVTRTVKERFDAESISIPFPQRDVHLFQESK